MDFLAWTKLFSNFRRVAAFSVDVEIENCYYWDESNPSQKLPLPEQPIPKVNKLFTESIVLNTARIYFRHLGKFNNYDRGTEKLRALTDYYGDELLVEACIRWLNTPLYVLPKNEQSSWTFPLLYGHERIMHIGRRDQSLNMRQIRKFIQTIIDV